MDETKGTFISDPIKVKCSRCLKIIAVYNEKGEITLRRVPFSHISFTSKYFEIKCKNCGEMNRIDNFIKN